MATLVNLDGALVAPADAKVSVLDRGFLYGDSVYEVVRTYGGRPFELDAHLARLARSAERTGLAPRWDGPRTAREIARTLEAAQSLGAPPAPADAAPWNAGEWYVRVVMTRGAGEIGLDPALAVDPQAVVIVAPLAAPPARAYAEGVPVAIASVRRASPAAVDPAAKTGAHLSHVLAVREARAVGAHEALLLDDAGMVTEGSSSNVFAVVGGRLRTPPLAAGILEGVTRGVVLRLARETGVPVEEAPLRVEALESADEAFLTSTMREILPVVRVGSRPVGTGRPGAVTERLHRAFRRLAGGPPGLGPP
ncbi:aminotransferase class IV [Anaeromyxobacter sp. K]|uniref:aminotransferase class IV n=1 Tax=Anaeromyxobacter sp. (strain K) TaxID=447217 RepID=UPI00017BE356|nr:aminotransferase class IV [Anaeromyxobacter sp. K]ACG73969.1 aminotransferase class IV [Anaeromyxobacter sp. K]